jgi:hypothetical protein
VKVTPVHISCSNAKRPYKPRYKPEKDAYQDDSLLRRILIISMVKDILWTLLPRNPTKPKLK